MWRFIRKHKVISAILAVIVATISVVWAWDESAAVRGRIDARTDLRRGKHQVLGYGLPSPSRPEYARCLRERYNVEFRVVDDCTVSRSLVEYVHAYHTVVADAMYRKHGRNIFKECAIEADNKWKLEHEASSGLSSKSAR